MKTRCFLLALYTFQAIPMIHAGENSSRNDGDESPHYLFVPGCCIRRMAPIKARVTHRHGDRAFLRTADGQRISIGGFGSSPDIVKFIASLKEDVTYTFPEVFLEHEKAMRGETFEVTDSNPTTIARHFIQDESPVRRR